MKTAKGGRKHRSAVSFCCDSSFAAPRGGRDANPPADYDVNPISTRAPRTGRDERAHLIELGVYLFQSSRPVWGATQILFGLRQPQCISILAPRAGRDMCLHPCPKRQDNFNPRAPCGARLFLSASVTLPFNFNPRAPHGARRVQCLNVLQLSRFQSARPARGATPAAGGV